MIFFNITSMQSRTITLILCLLAAIAAGAQTKLPLDSVINHWDTYRGQRVTITTPLFVTGVYYDSVQVAPERLFVPEQYAVGLSEGDSTRYYELKAANRAKTLRINAPYYGPDIMIGDRIDRLTATVTGPQQLLSAKTLPLRHDRHHDRLPDLGGATLRLCQANIQNYFADLGGYAGAKTEAEFRRQTSKVAQGLTYLNADLYALCEMEKGDKSPAVLVAEMNRLTHGKRHYAYVSLGHADGDSIAVCYVYRSDKVRPYGVPTYAYQDPHSHYHYRLIALGWEELATGERMVLSINHLRSKRGTPQYSDSARCAQIDSLMVMTHRLSEENTYGDADILLVGDWNCHREERPIVRLIGHGYTDVLAHYCPDDYSYVYRGESGYLDQAFASPTMMPQITAARPVHLCADYYYSLGYKRGRDLTMHRYSDHDPILIGIRLR